MIIENIKNYFKEINYLLSKDRNKILLLCPLFLVSSFLDLAGISLVVIFISLITNSDKIITGNSYIDYFDYLGVEWSHETLILIFGSILFFIFLFKAITAIYINKKILDISFQYGVRLRTFLMHAYQEMKYVDYLKRNSSEYVYNIQTMAGQFASGTLQSILRVLSEGIVVIVIFVFFAIYSGFALVILVLLILLVFISYDRIFKKRILKYGRDVNIFSTQLVRAITEGMIGFRENHIFGIAHFFNKTVHNNSKRLADARVKSTIIATSSRYLIELVLVTFIVLLVVMTVMTGGDMSSLISTLSMFVVAAMRILPSANQILTNITKIRFGRNSVSILYKDILRIYDNNHKMNFHEFESNLIKPDNLSSKIINEEFKLLELSDVSFSYPGSESLALDSISINIKKGESIGIIGASGSGKTTLIDIILGLLSPRKGTILFNNKNLQNNIENWQSQLAYLPQEIFLIDDTLRKNIALGIDELDIDNDKVLNALNQSKLKKVVDELPKGVDTVIGERGFRLSGGQRQRIALARAFYHDRNILVLDESTSSLDLETEKEIVNEIKALKGIKTLIVVAHRISTLQHCDKIYTIEKGRVVSENSYEDIIKN